MRTISLKDMMAAGLHFGHRVQKWNPKMAPYVYTEKAGIHIFDLQQTGDHLLSLLNYLYSAGSQGKEVLFVSTKLQSHALVKNIAETTSNHYVIHRWLGGLLTNFSTVKLRLRRLKDLRRMFQTGEIDKYVKKEQVVLRKELTKLEENLGGVVEMRRLPDVLFVVDAFRDQIAIREAKKLGIPVVGIADTNADSDWFDLLVPANDDAQSSLAYILGLCQEALSQGKAIAPKPETTDSSAPKKAAPRRTAPRDKVEVSTQDVAAKGDN